jgi:MSHA pilin protein MshD
MFVNSSTGRRRQAGLTLIELIVFIVIVTTAVAGILTVMNITVKSSADPMIRKQAMAIAEAILDEVLARDFANPAGGYTESSGTCANRALYDDVSDYHCFNAGSVNRIDGSETLGASSIATLSGYAASVDIDATTAALGLTAGTQVKTVTVVVTGNNETITLRGYRTNY